MTKKELNGDEWLTGRHINALNKLLLSKYLSQYGLTFPLILDEYKKYQASPENCVQIVNITRKHWVCASNIFSSSGIVDIYDSMPCFSMKSLSLKTQVAAILQTSESHFS